MYDSDVLIAGGGPIGIALAIDLAQRGITSTVVERYAQLQRIPKGQNMTQRTGEHFYAWGVSEQIRAASPIPPSYGNSGLTAYGSLLSGHHYDWFRRASVREFYAADNERAPQYETERVLRERAAQLAHIKLLTGWTAQSLTQSAEGVTLTIAETEGEQTQVLRGRYLVGCDGSNSRTREAAGIAQQVDARDRRMALLVLRSPHLDELLAGFAGKTIFNALHPDLNGYWQFLGRFDLRGGFFFHAPVPAGTSRDTIDAPALLERAVGVPVRADYEYIGFWDLRFALADSYRAGRVFIAGDAAHSHPPYGGYGINTGFEDARNLSWKLAAVLHGWGSDALLDTYSEERRPVFASTRDDFIAAMIDEDARFVARFNPATDAAAFEQAWQQRASAGDPAVGRFVPNYAGSSAVLGEPGARSSAIGIHEHRALAGFHLCPLVLADGTDVHPRLGEGFSLLAVDANVQDVAAIQAAATAAAVPLTTIVSQCTEQTARWQARLILIRPDHFIAFAGDDLPAPPADLLRRVLATAD